MELAKHKNHRLKNYDYSAGGYYYITICTTNKKCLLCNISLHTDEKISPFKIPVITPTKIGQAVINSFNNIAILNENVKIDKFVLMPNHIHAIIIINNNDYIVPATKKFDFEIAESQAHRSLQGLIKDFKSVTTRQYKKMYNTTESLWQKSFYDEVIINQAHYDKVWQYIEDNPTMWGIDEKL